MTLTSHELNYLVWRYLQESGFIHSTYAFQNESRVDQFDFKYANNIPVGSLVNVVQKGLQYMSVEAMVGPDGKELPESERKPYNLFGDQGISEDTPILDVPDGLSTADGGNIVAAASAGTVASVKTRPLSDLVDNGIAIITPVSVLDRAGEVVECQFNPIHLYKLATISKEAIIWDLTSAPKSTILPIPEQSTTYHKSETENGNDQNAGNPTAVAWSPNGSAIATAVYSGAVEIWSESGALRHTLHAHTAPVLVLRWNRPASMLMSVDALGIVVIWDTSTGELRQQWNPLAGISPSPGITKSSEPTTVDADWVDDLTLVTTGGNDLCVYRSGEADAVKRLKGHKLAVNTVRHQVTTDLLASGSDDHTVNIWVSSSPEPLHTLHGHISTVLCVRWHPLQPNIVASASLDSTIRLWNAGQGTPLTILNLHELSIFTIEFSGRFLASGGLDQSVIIWDTDRGVPVARYDQPKEVADSSQSNGVATHNVDNDEDQTNNTTNNNNNNNTDNNIGDHNNASGTSSSTVNSLSWDSSGTKLAVATSKNSVVLSWPS